MTSNSASLRTQLPEPVAEITKVMSSFGAPWALCGGWAVEAWLGQETRQHSDVDIMVFAADYSALFDHLSGWQMVAHGPNATDDWTDAWDGQSIDLPGHIHARLDTGEPIPVNLADAAGQGFDLDIQLSDRTGEDWVLSRDPLLTVPIGEAIRESPLGWPTVVLEVLLYYKSNLWPKDRLDFRSARPHLTGQQRQWLRNTIAVVGHPWLSLLTNDMVRSE